MSLSDADESVKDLSGGRTAGEDGATGGRVPPKARAIAFYLPQFHPIPENDEWWGKGFTEWTNTVRARPLFRGHYQPHLPAELGFYDLRVPEVRQAQAELARAHGIEAFCYYHYWFAGERLLSRPFEEVVSTGKPDFPFCLCWANQTWTGVWHGEPNRILARQTYPGVEDYKRHFAAVLPAFLDKRYLRVDGKPLFLVFMPNELPDPKQFTDVWRQLADRAGLPGVFLVGVKHVVHNWEPSDDGFDGSTTSRLPARRGWVSKRRPVAWIRNEWGKVRRLPTIYRYADVARELLYTRGSPDEHFPCVIPNWDNTPRSGYRGLVLHGATPELFRSHLRAAVSLAQRARPEHRLLFVKSWNEWAEGNHLEPDVRFGRGYLEVMRDELFTPS